MVALAVALAFAVAVPRRSANDLAPEVALLPPVPAGEPARVAA
jgi:hypothetical protein